MFMPVHLSLHNVPSPAKLNLFLHITGKRADGYHDLESIFQLIDLCDVLSFSCIPQDSIRLVGMQDIDPSQNLIYRAAASLLPYRNRSYGVEICIDKQIPMGAGLGGGSSNAATALLVLNHLWQCGLTQQQLIDLGRTLGADVPFFIFGQTAWVTGIGEQLTPVPLATKQYVVLKPDCFVSTQALFSQKTLTRNTKTSTFAAYQRDPSQFGNNFEPIARTLYPHIEAAFRYLDQYGRAQLTGTGACVFVELDENITADPILQQAPCMAFAVHSMSRSPVFDFIHTVH